MKSILLALAASLVPLGALAQATLISYQGVLATGGFPAEGSYDFTFQVYDAAVGGSPLGPSVTTNAVAVSKGVFAVTLDFGSGVFTGPPRWLELGVRTNGGASAFATLSPRQGMTPVPYALFAMTPAGPEGPVGPTGSQGPVGATGAAGAAGPPGPAGLNWRGIWAAAASYTTNDAVNYSGSAWMARRATSNVIPTEGADWTILAQKGELGAIGPQGATGPIGATGPGGPMGPSGPVGSTGPAGPQGAIGATGPQGPQGLPGSADAWSRTGNAATDPSVNFLGTSDNQPLEVRVNGNRALRLEPSVGVPNVILGSAGNSVATNIEAATIAGGGLPFYPNRVTASYGTVGGGTFNTASGGWATVAGGRDNTAGGGNASVGGGYNNVASGYSATIPGGDHCVAAGDYSFAAGTRASANHRGSFVWSDGFPALGLASSAENQFLVSASGGVAFSVYDAAFQVQGSALISKSAFTRATARQLAISHTGDRNWGLSLGYVFNPGVEAAGVIQALDAGNPAWLHINPAGGQVLLGSGSTVSWGDHYYSKLTPDQGGSIEVGNSLLLSATPYIDFHYGVNGVEDFNVRLVNDGSNQLTCSGNFRALSFSTTSDRNAKENFEVVNPLEVLRKVTALPLSRWSFKGEPAAEHLGPVAQDFHAAFGLGADDTHIATVDADGVALAAIQGLNQKVEEQRTDLQAKQARIDALETRLQHLERLLPKLATD